MKLTEIFLDLLNNTQSLAVNIILYIGLKEILIDILLKVVFVVY